MKKTQFLIFVIIALCGIILPQGVFASTTNEVYTFGESGKVSLNTEKIQPIPNDKHSLEWNKQKQEITGIFYIENLGIIEIKEAIKSKPGTNDVYGVEGKAISKSAGQVTIIGEIDMKNQLFKIKIQTNAGNYEENISITEKDESLFKEKDLRANHSQTLTLGKHTEKPGIKTLILKILDNHSLTRSYQSNNEHKFTNIDLSIATDYTYTLLDQEGKQIEEGKIKVNPNEISKTLFDGKYLFSELCDKNIQKTNGKCEQERSASDLVKYSDDVEQHRYPEVFGSYSISATPRDKYGNHMYITLGKRIFKNPTQASKNYSIKNHLQEQSTYVSDHDLFIPYVPQKPEIEKILLCKKKRCDYDEEYMDISDYFINKVDFLGRKAEVYIRSSKEILKQNETVNVQISMKEANPGEKYFAVITEGKEFVMRQASDSQCPLSTDIEDCFSFTDSISFEIINENNTTTTQNATIEVFAGNQVDKDFIIYPIASHTVELKGKEEVKLIENLGNGNISKEKKAQIFNKIRRNIGYLDRNKKDSPKYQIFSDDKKITEIIDKKESIIVEGRNITIDEDISEGSQIKAIIALKDKNGNGGNIIISDDVTDIYATLVAEGSITHSPNPNTETHTPEATNRPVNPEGAPIDIVPNDNHTSEVSLSELVDKKTSKPPKPKTQYKQLYIFGYILSNNYDKGCREDDCFESLRKNFEGNNLSGENAEKQKEKNLSKKVQQMTEGLKEKYQNTAIIHEIDSKILNNPPIGLEYFFD